MDFIDLLFIRMNMNKMFFVLLFFLGISVSSISNTASANTTVTVFTDKDTYSFGEFLTFTIEVSEITEQIAVVYIKDEFSKKSNPINIPVTETKTTISAPFPFEQTIFIEGRYYIEVEYDESTSSAEFNLIDAGNLIIPYWIKDYAKFWLNGDITDNNFAKGIEFLIKEDIIIVPETKSIEANEKVIFPDWIKFNTKWWIEGKISDNDFALGIEYLINAGIIVV